MKTSIFEIKKLRKTSKRFLFFTILILGIFLFFVFSNQNNQETIKYHRVQKQTLKSTISAAGTLAGKDTANLRFVSGGKLAFVNVKNGDRVFQGQNLAGLDSQTLAINLQQAQNNLRDKQAQLDKILDDIHLWQYGNGGFGNIGSTNETQTQRQLRTNAEVAKDNAYENLKSAQRAFQDSILTSPVNGLITQSNFLPGQIVTLTDTVFQVVDDSEFFFEAEVDESDLEKVSPGQEAEITFNTFGDKSFTGIVTKVDKTSKTTHSGSTIAIVKIKLSAPPPIFIWGLNGQALIIKEQKQDALTIPQEALSDENKVLVKTPEGFEEKIIQTGISSEEYLEVTGGLTENEEVINNPTTVKSSQRNSSHFFKMVSHF